MASFTGGHSLAVLWAKAMGVVRLCLGLSWPAWSFSRRLLRVFSCLNLLSALVAINYWII